jgi:hypothetical protein
MVFASVSDGHGVAHICREADDSYCEQSRWVSIEKGPPRGGFFVASLIAQRQA